jgi:hypothetical protein
MTRRLAGHADKNEEALLSHSNRAISTSNPSTSTKLRDTDSTLCVNKEKRFVLKKFQYLYYDK